jgi:hypothetical protein
MACNQDFKKVTWISPYHGGQTVNYDHRTLFFLMVFGKMCQEALLSVCDTKD